MVEVDIRDIQEEFFKRGLEVMLIPLYDGAYHISPYPLYIEPEDFTDETIIDWLAGAAKAISDEGWLGEYKVLS